MRNFNFYDVFFGYSRILNSHKNTFACLQILKYSGAFNSCTIPVIDFLFGIKF